MDRVTQMVVKPGRRKMTRRTAQEKLTIVEQTFLPGMSVSRVARANDVNANQVFDWRKQYHEGRLGSPQGISDTWIPVTVETAPAVPAAHALPAETVPDVNGTVCLELPKGKLSVSGHVDPDVLRTFLQCLLR